MADSDVPKFHDIFAKPKKRTRSSISARSTLVSRPMMPGLFDQLPQTDETDDPRSSVVKAQTTITEPKLVESSAPAVQSIVWTVSALMSTLRNRVEREFARLTIEGEISNWRKAASGHCYFTLKDGEAQVSVVMFRREAALLRFAAKDGDAVRLRGSLSVFEPRGQMQVVAETMQLAGFGALLAAVQELKEKLKREGVFTNKRALPMFPRCIGVVTSLQGAALRDIVKVCRRRHAAVNLLIFPVSVQGPQCAVEVTEAVRWFSAHPSDVDVVLVARGGGSWEDLHGFNDERVVRAIAACAVPVVVGVGHATDSVLADAAADICAPTPSAAAELVTAAQHRVEVRIDALAARLQRAGLHNVLECKQQLSRLSAERVLRSVSDSIGRRAQRVDVLSFRVESALTRNVQNCTQRLTQLQTRLLRQDIKRQVSRQQERLTHLQERMRRAAASAATEKLQRVERLRLRAEAMSPLRVLDRGYALIYGPQGKLLRTSTDVHAGETISARLAQGSLRATVESN